MHYQIYIPEVFGASPQHLRDVGLAELLDDGAGPQSCEVLIDGPDGGRGTCFYWEPCANPGYHPDCQQWNPAKPRGALVAKRFWLGKDLSEPLEPGDLLRAKHLSSGKVELADGQYWAVPHVRMLPHRYELNPCTGAPVRVLCSQYEHWAQKANEYFQQILQWRRGGGGDLAISQAWGFAVESLVFNYRVNHDVVDWLGLLDDISFLRMLTAIFELDALSQIEAQKKTEHRAIRDS